MRFHSIIVGLACTAPTLWAQAAPRERPLGAWNVEYERTISSMHAEPRKVLEHGRMTLRAIGDSLIGELTVGDSASAYRSVLRGAAARDAWTLYVEEPPAKGFGLFFAAIGSAMEWLKESVHGIQPVVVRFDLSVKGDSINGSRLMTGGMGGTRNSTVHGLRIKP